MSILDQLKKRAAEKAAEKAAATIMPDVSVDIMEPASTTEPAQPTAPASKLGLKLKPIGVKPAADEKPAPTAAGKLALKPQSPIKPILPKNKETTTTAPKASVLPAGGILAKLKERAANESPVAAVSQSAMAAHEYMEDFDLQQLFSEWPAVADDDEDNVDENTETRHSIIADAVARLNTLFTNHLDMLKTADAGHPAITELSQIAKLTMLRLQDAPACYSVLGDGDRSALVRAMMLMASKRQSAALASMTRKKGAADLEKMSQPTSAEDELREMMGEDFATIDLDMGF